MTGSDRGPQAARKNEGAARALYDRMLAALRAADALSYVSSFRREREGQEVSRSTCRVWMKKPNYARVEAVQDSEVTGILVLDGERL